jgi:dTDP-4-dehydrorhamnose reductase
MRLLLTGANGQVGWELRRSLMSVGEVVALDRSQCNLVHPERLRDVVRGIDPAVVVNAAAYTSVDEAEQDEHTAMTVNGTAVGVLAEEARTRGALLVHYSTDYVFDGTKQSPYVEEDSPHPLNVYGRSKLAGEIAITESGAAHLILRTSWVYAARGRNFVRTVLRLASERDEIKIVADQSGTPNWARNIADVTAHAVRQAAAERASGTFVSGLFHLTATGRTSWHGFAQATVEHGRRHGLVAADRPARLVAIPTAEYPTPAARPNCSCLSGARFAERFGVPFPDWRQALPLCLMEIETCRR